MSTMGNKFHKCKLFVSLSTRRDILSEKAFRAVCIVVDFLKLNVDSRNVFHDTGYRRRVRQMAAYIASGNSNLQNYMLERSPVEVAAGLQYYLIRLPKDLVPKYIQNLALDADGSTEPEIVAADMLGLMYQDLRGRHRLLVMVLLDMLYFLRKHAHNDELAGSNVPISLLPIFFGLQARHLRKWRLIANIFMEMINLSPTYLPIQTRLLRTPTSEHQIEERDLQLEEDILQEPQAIYEDEENVILHQVLIRNGSEGDANFAEIINMNRLRHEVSPKMLNPALGYYIRRFR